MPHVFLHAVASFEPTDMSVLLWTRLTGRATASWTVARDAAMTDVVARGESETDASRNHTIVVDVTALEPATSYWYRFDAEGEASPVGRTRTLPAAPVTSFRIGLVSCARYSMAPLGAYRAMAEREADLVVHLGDYIYEDDGGKGPRTHRPAHAAVTLDDYRQRIAQVREDPDCQALHLRHPMTLLVDDHDVADNCWTNGAKAHDPETQGRFSERAIAATRARQEWVPSRLRDPADTTTTWRSMVIGDLAELVLLDTRLSGRDRQAGDDEAKDLHDPDRSLLGDEQRQWMEGRLADPSRPWVLLGTGVVVNEVSLPLPAATALVRPALPNGYDAIDGKILHDDQWDGYPAERRRLTEALAARGATGNRTIILSGDIHSSWAFEGPRLDGSAVAVEFTSPAVSSNPMGRSRAPGAWRLLDAIVRSLEHVPWADVTSRGYGLLDLTPDDATMAWWFVEATDDDPGATERLGAAFRTRRSSWPPRLEPCDAPPRDPIRPGLPAPLPPRPADLARLRRRHQLRQVVARGSGTALVLGATAGLAGAIRHRPARRRRSGSAGAWGRRLTSMIGHGNSHG